LAFALIMVAYSLRTWRRNGVACDELLFLPGTAHADNTMNDDSQQGQSSPSQTSQVPPSSRGETQYAVVRSNSHETIDNSRNQRGPQDRLEGDVAAGVGSWNQINSLRTDDTQPESRASEMNSSRHNQLRSQFQLESLTTGDVELTNMEEAVSTTSDGKKPYRTRLLSKDSTISSINEFENNSWDDDPLNVVDEAQGYSGTRQNNSSKSSVCSSSSGDNLMVPLNNGEGGERPRTNSTVIANNEENIEDPPCASSGHLTMRAIRSHVVSDIREGQAQITRIGSLFFFRATTTSTQNAAYAPSGPSVVGAALDLSMPILFNFHLFIQAWNHLESNGSKNPAKILPMCFLTALTVRSFIPFGRRGRFWGTMKYTMTAPLNRTRFRDSFLGDVLTSLVRPLQDVAFSAAYYICGLWGLMSGQYNLTESGDMLESSWVVHTVILPSCALLPLWWRFLQTLRESYDAGQRWPYLGNSFKYLSAAVVIMYGMTHPEERGSITWMTVFFLTTLYQIWWDTVMDWELFVIVPRSDEASDSATNISCCTRISSIRPNSYHLLTFQRHILNPVVEAMRSALTRIPSWKQFQIRPRRLYKSEAFYWKIFFFNTLFRFTWMLSFIPSYSLAQSRKDPKEEFESDTDSYIGVLLPVAEIFRRTLWGFLLLEIQTIHITDGDPDFRYSFSSHADDNDCDESQDEESESAVSVDSSKHTNHRSAFIPSWLVNQLQIQDHVLQTSPSAYLSKMGTQVVEYLNFSPSTLEHCFVAELCIWAGAFVGLGLWATSQDG
jgi:EXS family